MHIFIGFYRLILISLHNEGFFVKNYKSEEGWTVFWTLSTTLLYTKVSKYQAFGILAIRIGLVLAVVVLDWVSWYF